MAEDLWIYWIIFAAYMAFLVISALRAKQKTHTLEDFMVAGRSIGPILLGLSFGVTYFSAVMIIGGGALSYVAGLGTIWITVFNAIIGILLIYTLFGKRTRVLSSKLGVMTVPEFLGKRYQSGALHTFTAVSALILETVYLVSVFMGLSILFTVIMPDQEYAYPIAVVITAAISIVYINIGGSHGAIFTDVAESLIMLISVIVILIMGLNAVGGLDGLQSTIGDIPAVGDQMLEFPGLVGFTLISTCLSTSFGVWGNPAMISRYFTAKNKRSLRWGLVISLVWALLVGMIAWFNGSIGRAYVELNPDPDWTGPNNIPKLMFAVLPSCLVGTSAFARDIYQRKTGADDVKTMKVTKVTTVVMVVTAAFVSLFNIAGVLDLCMFSFDVMCACFLVPYVFGLYWKKGTAKGAIVSGSVGMFLAVLWWIGFSSKSAGLNNIFGAADLFPLWETAGSTVLFNIGDMGITLGSIAPLIPSQLVVITLFVVVSLKTQPPEKEFLDEIFEDMERPEDDVIVEDEQEAETKVRPAPTM